MPVRKFRSRSIEDAQRQREVWEEANFRALWESRGIKPEELRGRKV
jgi:hypothetical protein